MSKSFISFSGTSEFAFGGRWPGRPWPTLPRLGRGDIEAIERSPSAKLDRC